jgi:hypothetical protein
MLVRHLRSAGGGSKSFAEASGGTESSYIGTAEIAGSESYKVHTFTSSGIFIFSHNKHSSRHCLHFPLMWGGVNYCHQTSPD